MSWTEIAFIASSMLLNFVVVVSWAYSVSKIEKAAESGRESMKWQIDRYEMISRQLLATVIGQASQHPGVSATVARELVRQTENLRVSDQPLPQKNPAGPVEFEGVSIQASL